ncbi:MAG: M20 family metallopeptidase [Thomasclavelia sp.]|nr:M20 family metallopeptidase [Thomasclavelia sp.]
MTSINDLKRWRQDLHQIPEIGFKEVETTAYLKKELESLGYNVNKLLDTGVYVYIDNNKDKTIAFRSDIDALKLTEETGVSFKSKHFGYMHGCGHDGHMSALLGLAKRLKESNDYPYNYLLIFQPAEELAGGSIGVIKTGILKKYNVQAIFGMHLMPDYPKGKICCKEGPLMAQNGELDITIKGKSAHAGKAHLGVDAVVIASEIVNSIQLIVSRELSAFHPTIINIGKMNAGTIRNIVAEDASLEGTVRVFDENDFKKIQTEINSIAKACELKYGCKVDVKLEADNPPVNNDSKLYQEFLQVVDKDNYLEVKEPLMLSEDYSHYQKEIPGIFFFLGTQTKDNKAGLHTGKFNFNEDILLKAVDTYYSIATKIKLGD